jgi:hypothetical protein
LTLVGPEEIADSPVPTFLADEHLKSLTGSVCGSVVNDDDLEFRVGLRENTSESGLYLLRPIESRDNYRY